MGLTVQLSKLQAPNARSSWVLGLGFRVEEEHAYDDDVRHDGSDRYDDGDYNSDNSDGDDDREKEEK